MRVSTQKSATDPRTGQIDMDALSTGTTVHPCCCHLAFSAICPQALPQASSRARAHDILRNVRSFLQTQTRSNVSLREVLDMLRTTMPQDNISDSDVRTCVAVFSQLVARVVVPSFVFYFSLSRVFSRVKICPSLTRLPLQSLQRARLRGLSIPCQPGQPQQRGCSSHPKPRIQRGGRR